MKEFWITDSGDVSRHKIRQANIVGHGILHPGQLVIVYTTEDRILRLDYEEIKVGTHEPSSAISFYDGEKITKIDIISVRKDNE